LWGFAGGVRPALRGANAWGFAGGISVLEGGLVQRCGFSEYYFVAREIICKFVK